jgi:hypothetical protein
LLIKLNLIYIIICGFSIRVSQFKHDNRTILNLSRNVVNEVHVFKTEKDEMKKKIENLRDKINFFKKIAINTEDNIEGRI